ncbi:hypothetical protein Bhyg_08392 [Pseudolycoriella hygida]|uniref:Uncharacterized protein n=1 Tax=Pseudolycoriella hygida TaxID=35572 RepID=A0A9Q0N5W3_9DIPT|nr:hypothetical protein Bhyg_08392 [Pseudolycoriella hygida]
MEEVVEDVNKNEETLADIGVIKFSIFFAFVYFFVKLIIAIVNIIVSYWFIRGVTSC